MEEVEAAAAGNNDHILGTETSPILPSPFVQGKVSSCPCKYHHDLEAHVPSRTGRMPTEAALFAQRKQCSNLLSDHADR